MLQRLLILVELIAMIADSRDLDGKNVLFACGAVSLCCVQQQQCSTPALCKISKKYDVLHTTVSPI